ncbi:metallophosphoesterase [Anaerovorax odorimutans]|uniref:metallophosphoesterase n=1 Tax=Anaerovorax odorimutans TaxID=109327 RepID=UPI00041EB459|nr:metallophosphoesterase [Anaerovorax odorimutans]
MLKLLKKFFRTIFLLIIIVILILGYSKYIEPFMLKTESIKIESPYVTDNSNGLNIVVFADTHFSEFYTTDDFKKVLNSIKEINPDIVVFAGDLIDNYNNYTEDISDISHALASINAPLGKFAIFGNHDYGGGAENEYEEIMSKGGFIVLKNEYYALDRLGISIIGIDDVLIGNGDTGIASWSRPDYFNIVLCHEPDLADEILEYNVDLMISAHTHGRQINLFGLNDDTLPLYGKNYIKGIYQFNNFRDTKLYVNSGIGMTKLPYRFMSRPELTCITITKP